MAALALMGILASCQSDDEAVSLTRPNNAVGINVSVGSLKGTTRSNPAATDPDETHLFNLGDQVCVSTEGQDPVLFQCTDADQQTWAEAVSNKFLLWTQSEMTFKAYYPATTGTSMTAFNLPADQSSVEKIALADYMTRQQTCTNEYGTDINLNLERKTARVIVHIAGFNDQYFNNQKTVSNVRIYSEASGIENGNPTGISTEITPYAQGTGGQGSTYTALVVPGYGDGSATFITLTDGANNNLSVKGIPELEAGNSYTFNLTVGKNTIQVQSVTVTDWTTGEILAGGQAHEVSASVTAITLNKTETQLGVGNTETLSVSSVTPDNATDQTVTWSSDNPSVATVDASTGEVTGVAKGTANITATANDGSGVSATCAVNVSTLAAAFVNGAVIQVYFKWDGNIAGDYVQGTYNASYGSFEADMGGNNWSLDDDAVYRVVKSGNNITISAGRYDYEYEGMEWTFNAASDTYTYTPGLYVNEEPNDYGLISVTLNGIDITNQLTKQ